MFGTCDVDALSVIRMSHTITVSLRMSHTITVSPHMCQVMIDLLSASSQNFDNDLVRHNLVVFRNGENALQVLPPLLDVIPEGE